MEYTPSFPKEFQEVAAGLLSMLSVGEQWPAQQGFIVTVQSQQLSAPLRVYYNPSRLRSAITGSIGEARILAQCLGTRHHDGYMREECLRQIIFLEHPLVVPFVVQLLGEYVIEIANVIAAAVPSMNAEIYGKFVRDNRQFIATTKRRAISYWDCYYRHQYPKIQTYPGLSSIETIERMA